MMTLVRGCLSQNNAGSIQSPSGSSQMTEYKDEKGKVIARSKDEGSRTLLFDAKGHKLGTYDSKLDETRDAKGHKVGSQGNSLFSFLRD